MRPVAAGAALLTASLILSACDNSASSGPGAVSEGEARALDEAAEMLEEQRLPEGVLPDSGADAASEQGPHSEEAASQ